jgi:glycosyltransferase involved in cell wall biosynthesis
LADINQLHSMDLLIISGIFPPDIGGPATYVPQIAQGLGERGHSVTILTQSDNADYPDQQYAFRVARILRHRFKLWIWLRALWMIIVYGRRAEVLLVNGMALQVTLANLLLRKPLVLKVVGDFAWERATTRGWVMDTFEDFQSKRYGIRVELLKVLRAWWTRRATRIIAPSRYIAKWIQKWGVRAERIAVVFNSTESSDVIQALPLSVATTVKIVTVSRLVPLKRIDELMRSVAKLDSVGLVIVGDGQERTRLEELTRELQLQARVYFAGARSKEETLRIMAACDIFTLNSTHEGMPHVVLEAMGLGIPVVATAVGGVPEIVRDGETGILIEPADGAQLDRALKTLVDSREMRQRFGESAKRWARQFSVANMLTQTEQVLQNAIEVG